MWARKRFKFTYKLESRAFLTITSYQLQFLPRTEMYKNVKQNLVSVPIHEIIL